MYHFAWLFLGYPSLKSHARLECRESDVLVINIDDASICSFVESFSFSCFLIFPPYFSIGTFKLYNFSFILLKKFREMKGESVRVMKLESPVGLRCSNITMAVCKAGVTEVTGADVDVILHCNGIVALKYQTGKSL